MATQSSYDEQNCLLSERAEMLLRGCRTIFAWFSLFAIACLGGLVILPAQAQETSVTRLPIDTDMTVRLVNLTTHTNYDRSGNSFFIVPAGRYSVQLLRDGQIVYQEVEFIGPEAPSTRTVNPQRMEIVMGLPDGGPQFSSNLCAAMITGAQLAIRNYGLHDADIQRRLANAEIAPDGGSCATPAEIDDLGQTVAGSYGVTPLGLLTLSIEFTQLTPSPRPRNHGNSTIYTNPDTQRLTAAGPGNANLTPSLVADLRNGMPDVAFNNRNQPLLVCAALDANTPVFCDTNGLAVATPAIAALRGVYRFHVATKPVDNWGTEFDRWTTLVGQDESDAIQDRLITAVASLKTHLDQRIAQVESPIAAQDSASGARTYATADLLTLIQATQSDFDQALHDGRLRPLRQHFPKALSQVVNPGAPMTSETDALRIFRELRNAVSVLDSVSDSLAIDLVFRSTPVETESTHLNFVACARCTPIVSQGGQHRFIRGKYYIQATLDGYVAYEGWLDLVDDPRHILDCNMVRIRRAPHGHASSCSLQAQ